MEKNVAGQKWIVFAFDETDNTAKTGDAANITANLRIDGGAANAVDDTNPTELEDGYYIFDITQAESNGDLIVICPASSTANIQVIGVPGAVWTRPANYNAQSIDSNGRVDVIKVAGTTQTANDNGADINAILTDTNELQGDLTDGGRLDLILDAILTDTGTTLDGKINTIDTNVDAILVDTGTTLDGKINTIDTVVDAIKALLDDARAEPGQGAPPVNPDAVTKIDYLYKFLRNKLVTSATTIEVYDDAGTTVDHKSTISDDGSDFTRGEFVSGP